MKDLVQRIRERLEEEAEDEPEEDWWSEFKLLKEAADALERYQWIPVSERLPEPDKNQPNLSETVLVYNGNCGVLDRYIANGEWFNLPHWWDERGGVTHWMPGPPPPDTGEAE